jgi:pilus assembly protein Flp/PilA
MIGKMKSFKKGQGLVEYALILVLIAIVVIVILTFLGGQVNNTFSRIGSAVNP